MSRVNWSNADAGYQNRGLRVLNVEEINWNPRLAKPCTRCGTEPTAGCYASTLWHYERALGASLLGQRTKGRILVLFQDPRPDEDNFEAADPRLDPAQLGPTQHRYFCLTANAWRDLGLNDSVAPTPCWPTEQTAHLYLRRYFRRGPGKWSYDGFIAYFLYLLRPLDAYVTDLAKCYFKNQPDAVYDNCAEAHLAREIRLFEPNVVLSFTKKLTLERIHKATAESIPIVNLYHPAAWARVNAQTKAASFVSAANANRERLTALGHNVDQLIGTWQEHVARALATSV